MRVIERGLMLVIGGILILGMSTIGFPSIADAKKSKKVKYEEIHDNGLPGHNAEMTAQHAMIKDKLAATQAAIQADLATLQATVDALQSGMGGPVCGTGTQVGRFVVNAGEACDTKTGLKWQDSPDTTLRNHADALAHCTSLGNSYRLPGIQELHSVLDYAEFNPALTPGVFSNINVLGFYWSATSAAADSDLAWLIRVETPNVPAAQKTDLYNVWCVR